MTGNGAEEGQVELELCQLCNRSDLALDKLYRDRENRICAHSHCLLFSSGLQQDGDEDDQDQEEGEGGKGIQGFLPHHIKEELKRGYKLRCSYCGKRGATVGCAKPTCKRSYHLPCGIENQTTQQHFGQFKSFCPQHQPRPKVKPCPSQTDAKSISGRCAFCPEEVVLPLNSGSFSSLLTPCCQALLHRSCAQDSAVSLGYYHFECPACKNLTTYRSEMRRLGIYVPVPDNKTPPLTDLLCAAKICIYAYDARLSNNICANDLLGKIVTCHHCQSKGIHTLCGGLHDFIDPDWFCYTCRKNGRARAATAHKPLVFAWGRANGSRNGEKVRTKQEWFQALIASCGR